MSSYEENIIAAHSTPGLKKNQLTRAAKKLNMEFDSQFHGMNATDCEAFLDCIFPVEPQNV